MKLEIKKYPAPVLRKKTVKIKDPLAADVQELVLNMLETMRASKGVGLAAPQVGSDFRLCVIETEEGTFVLINPKITSRSRKKIVSEEGCLSFPGEFFPISRCDEVQARYLDEHGKPGKIKARGLLAKALQHEIDHLDGILIIDHIKKSKPAATKEKK